MTNQEPASILLIDDHPMLRTGVKQLVSMAPDITVVGEASNGDAPRDKCAHFREINGTAAAFQ